MSFDEFNSQKEIKKSGNTNQEYQDQKIPLINNSIDVSNPINNHQKKLKRNRSLMDVDFRKK
jgi:hypothetical protein